MIDQSIRRMISAGSIVDDKSMSSIYQTTCFCLRIVTLRRIIPVLVGGIMILEQAIALLDDCPVFYPV